ncbi:MAG: restriction endonuclease subunit S [Pseudomonas proteolytica]|uniref:restriction endonuclease subunit S n=1 Tax=Pseudomonas proteolytica TaxID=219574 RepID=UPI003F3D4D06
MSAKDASVGALAWPKVKLGNVSELCLGKMLDAAKNKGEPHFYLRNPDVRWFDIDTSNLRQMPFESHELDRYGLLAGDVLICEGGEAGRAAIWSAQLPNVKFQKAIHRVRTGPKLLNRFLVHRLKYDFDSGRLADYYTGATIKHLTGRDLARYEFSLPPVPDQQRIVAILDKADALRAKRRGAIAKLDQLLQSVFLEMFGDPVTNPKGWPIRGIAELAEQLRDGPFGSNLKSEHYQSSGIRVIRLQNIGVWRFLGNDAAYVSEEHFASLPRNHCRPGDVLIGTLGDPNLRACILPSSIERALNKADCLLFRPERGLATAEYICGLMNCKSLIQSASGLALGQTRLRISMGRLKELSVPLPPLELQQRFTSFCEQYERERDAALKSMAAIEALFSSFQTQFFR